MTTNWTLGRECTLTIDGVELKLAKEVTVEMGGPEADVTTRGSGGVRQTVLAMRELTISGTVLYSPDDTAVQSLLAAYNSGAPLTATLSDPTLTYSGAWAVTSLSNGQPLEDAATLDFTMKPTLPQSSSSGI